MSGVRMTPGATAFTRMPSSAYILPGGPGRVAAAVGLFEELFNDVLIGV